jgi:hypothetical protein
MKLELTLPALERLIGGDSEVEAQLRRQIAQAFAFRYLKGIVDQDMIEVVRSQVVGECRQELESLLNERIGYLKLTSGRYQVQLEEGIQKRVDAYIAEHLEKLIEKSLAQSERRIKASIESFIGFAMTSQVNDVLKKTMQANIAEVLRTAFASKPVHSRDRRGGSSEDA